MASSHKSPKRKVGTFIPLVDGRIKVVVCQDVRLDGKRRRLTEIAKDEADAERVALELAAELGRRPDLGRGLTLERWWIAYTATKGKRLTKAAFKRYQADFDAIWLPRLGKRDISLITRNEVQDILLTLPSRSAASHAKASLSAVLTQAVRDGQLSDNPIRQGGFELPGDVGVVDEGIDLDDPFGTIEGDAEIWDARTTLRAMEILRGNSIEPLWLAMIGAGLRREEALALLWKDIRRVEILGREVTQIAVYKAKTALDGVKQTKTRRSKRIVTVVEPFGTRLWELAQDQSPEAEICKLGPDNLTRYWGSMWKPCRSKHARVEGRRKGIMVDGVEPPIPRIPLNNMRRTHETWMQQAGVIDSINAASHGHSTKVSYEHYQRAGNVEAARQTGEFLLVEGGGKRSKEPSSVANA